jgi:hypothetical protein
VTVLNGLDRFHLVMDSDVATANRQRGHHVEGKLSRLAG